MKALSVACVALVLLLGSAGIAHAERHDLRIFRDSTIGGTLVARGDYTMELNEARDSLTILRGKKTVATLQVRVEPLQADIPGDSVVVKPGPDGSLVVTRILLADAKLAIHIGQ